MEGSDSGLRGRHIVLQGGSKDSSKKGYNKEKQVFGP